MVESSEDITAWMPPVPGIREVFHAHFTRHAYPSHTHDSWTLLIVDDGAVAYGLGRHQHGALRSLVTLLPPDVPHDGRPARVGGFRKRVLYLDRGLFDDSLIGAAVDSPGLRDPLLRVRVSQLHDVLARRTEPLAAESRLTLIEERLHQHLRSRVTAPAARQDPGMARRLRDLLDARLPQGVTLGEASRLLNAHPAHLVRVFGAAYGIPPHLYVTGRRVDQARRYLLAGHPVAETATMAGFFDQSHLTRHFKRMLGTTPARYARTGTPS